MIAPRIPVGVVPISLTTYSAVLDLLGEPAPAQRARTYAFCNVHAVITAQRRQPLRDALRSCDVTAPDGMPLVWALGLQGHALPDRVYGPDLMEAALRRGVDLGWRHFFYGATPATLDSLVDAVTTRVAPGVDVAGTLAPPFRPLDAADEDAAVAAVESSGATHVWLALGLPKQELLMARIADRLGGRHVLAVGAAFDFLSGTVAQAPDWLQDRGLEWAWRLAHEPRRLLGRYLVSNPAFLLLLARLWLRRGLTRPS